MHIQWRIQRGFGGSNEPPLEPKFFHFHGEFQEKLVKLHNSNPPQLIWTPDPKFLDPPLISQANACNLYPDVPSELNKFGKCLTTEISGMPYFSEQKTFLSNHVDHLHNREWCISSGGSRGGSGVQTNPLLSLNSFIFMGNFRKNWSNCTIRTPLS